MPSLIGNKPNQVPSNGDLGTLAFQDANAVNITGGIVDVSAGTAALPSLGTTGDENTGIYFPAADTIAVSTNGAERMRITSTGVVELAQGQIKFPATQVASADANTLDDYEEGTFTATITTTTGSVTLKSTLNTVAYTKVGRVVTVTGLIGILSVSSPTGAVTINALPFAVANLTQSAGAIGGAIIYQDAPTYATTNVGFSAEETATGILTTQSAAVLGADDQYRFSFSYFTT